MLTFEFAVISQILYRHLTVSYDIIPFLSLIMSSIILTSNIIGHVYDGYIKWKERNKAKGMDDTLDVQEDEKD